MKIGSQIQMLRKARGLSQEELAAQIGVSRQAVSKWESGQNLPDLEKVVTLSDFFGVTTDYLMRDGANAPPPEKQAPDIPADLPKTSSISPQLMVGIATTINLAFTITYALLEAYFHSVLCLIPAVVGCASGTAVFFIGMAMIRHKADPEHASRAYGQFLGSNIWLFLFPIPFSMCWYIPSWSLGTLQFRLYPLLLYGLLAAGLSAYFLFFRESKL